MPNNACPNRITETSGTDFCQDFWDKQIIICIYPMEFTAIPSLPPQNFSRSSFRSLPNILHCRLLTGV